MELYKDLNNPQSKEFEQLLNNQLSKIQIEEGKIINGKINKITEKFVFLFVFLISWHFPSFHIFFQFLGSGTLPKRFLVQFYTEFTDREPNSGRLSSYNFQNVIFFL